MQAQQGVPARTDQPPANSGASAIQELAQAGVAYLAARATRTIDDWTEGIDRLATPHGPVEHATASGIQAALADRNPVWAAVKGAWSGGTVKTRVLMVLLAVAVLLTAVVALVLLLLPLLIEAVVAAVRALAR